MSNYLAIAAVTSTLRDLLQEAAARAVPGAILTTSRPARVVTGGQDQPGINLFLYQVSPNIALSNNDLPTRSTATGLYMHKPAIALDLYYLLSFQGSDLTLDSQRLLGSAMIALHNQPILTIANITATIQANSFLSQSDLATQVELVKFHPLNLSLEELGKMWSVFFQIPYILSVAYEVSVVIIEADVPVQLVKPVAVRNIQVTPGASGS
jgi:hypothetical protein